MEAGLAQLAARESHNLKVVGSSPTSRSFLPFAPAMGALFIVGGGP